ncbi:hypothetical protein FJW07_20185 [Mesorhizobium sp. B3-1-9]|uniref:hypothetical protein n=1 Tax=unclassified Mesorhizobium TaxID=325217 RepID=UPI0011280FE5|nr:MULTISPECIES: hypothetical protein [unclassified Mesorhizobium]TPI32712.1 hypothetical protein FJ414_21915 [Mesorhizobium sp. B3-1-6]TPI36900.1 hypothetical protein FJW07_20185 [Mesorhizobium sp. B3-1-9]TPI57467.1 hypothetical protein FJ417_22160 [Mesorhizobium sp. B3-1-7]TPJ37072.1 hypothetical protein FJ418_02055 [Mesorhizobium sp. B2-8-3]UCI28119.1 hypothetical protein FJ430_11190 [Mesorhizobium sp. B2-8-5]
MEDRAGSLPNVADFVIHKVLDTFEYSDRGAVITMVDPQGARIRLHVNIVTGELLCEHIAEALEQRYGK